MKRVRGKQGGLFHGELVREHFTRLWGIKWRVMTHLRLPACPYCEALTADRHAQEVHINGPCWLIEGNREVIEELIDWWLSNHPRDGQERVWTAAQIGHGDLVGQANSYGTAAGYGGRGTKEEAIDG